MTRGIFVTGTNTEVGKTVVTRAIVRALTNRKLTVRALKPVESGATKTNDHLEPQDAKALLKASNFDGEITDLCSYSFEQPVSPHVAAALAGITIEPEIILSLIKRPDKSKYITIVEGAGGLLVPLSEALLYADVVAQADLGLVIVSPNVLGTINSTLLTIEAARTRNIPIIGVILNRTPASNFGNAEAISHHGKVSILGEFPDAHALEDDDKLAELAEKHIDLSQLF